MPICCIDDNNSLLITLNDPSLAPTHQFVTKMNCYPLLDPAAFNYIAATQPLNFPYYAQQTWPIAAGTLGSTNGRSPGRISHAQSTLPLASTSTAPVRSYQSTTAISSMSDHLSQPASSTSTADHPLDPALVEELPKTVNEIQPEPIMDEATGKLTFPCPYCEKKYTGKHARSIWRRHLQDKHEIPLALQPRKTRWDNGR